MWSCPRRWAKWDVELALSRLLALSRWYKIALPGEEPRQWKQSDFKELFDSGVSRYGPDALQASSGSLQARLYLHVFRTPNAISCCLCLVRQAVRAFHCIVCVCNVYRRMQGNQSQRAERSAHRHAATAAGRLPCERPRHVAAIPCMAAS